MDNRWFAGDLQSIPTLPNKIMFRVVRLGFVRRIRVSMTVLMPCDVSRPGRRSIRTVAYPSRLLLSLRYRPCQNTVKLLVRFLQCYVQLPALPAFFGFYRIRVVPIAGIRQCTCCKNHVSTGPLLGIFHLLNKIFIVRKSLLVIIHASFQFWRRIGDSEHGHVLLAT